MPFILIVAALMAAGYFLPVKFRLRFGCNRDGFRLSLEMSALGGMLRKERAYGYPRGDGGRGKGTRTGATAGDRKERRLESGRELEMSGIWQRLGCAVERLRHYGLGGAMLSYFVPKKALPWFQVAGYLERKGRFTFLDWRTTLGLGEAALTAWSAGLLWAVKSAIVSALGRRYGMPRKRLGVSVIPSFADGRRLVTDLDCIFTLRMGHIIAASVRGYIRDKLQRSAGEHDERASNRRPHENGDAEHQGNGGCQHDPRRSRGNA
ncbi:MAG: DUF2953 domain-containing protein [Patescibacteria group bacterium]